MNSLSVNSIMGRKPPRAPGHLSASSKKLYKTFHERFDLSDLPSDQKLIMGLESLDRADAAREQVNREGMVVPGADGQVKPHPLLCAERDNRAAYLAAIRALKFDVVPPSKKGR